MNNLDHCHCVIRSRLSNSTGDGRGPNLMRYFGLAFLILLAASGSSRAGLAWSDEMLEAILAATPIDSLVTAPANDTVAANTTHTLTFALSGSLPPSAILRITFPFGFQIADAIADFDNGESGPNVQSTTVDGLSLQIALDGSGGSTAPGVPLTLTLDSIENSQVARFHQIVLEVLDADSTLRFGPTFSTSFILVPAAPATILLTPPSPFSLAAGSTITFTSVVEDQYQNVVEPPDASYTIVPARLGVMFESVFLAQRVDTGRVIVAVNGLTDTSGLISVVPGSLASWDVTGLPLTVMAGEAFSVDSVRVLAKDQFGNLKSDYLDSLYFTATDPAASFPVNASSPYLFTPSDSGQVGFAGTSFIMRTAGADTIRTLGGGAEHTQPIVVGAAPASDFLVSGADTVSAGVGFTIAATSVLDVFANLASGNIELYVNGVDSMSPGGFMVQLPVISALGGVGQVEAILYTSGTYSVMARLGDTIRTLGPVVVLPGPADSFLWSLASPQHSTVPFAAPALLTALDLYGNSVSNYDVFGSTVTISASNGDTMSNEMLAPSLFAAGTADLAAAGVTYHGRGGQVSFQATSGSASGNSGDITVGAFTVEAIVFDQSLIRRGSDTLTGYITVRIAGGGVASVTGLQLTSAEGVFTVSDIVPSLPDTLSGATPRSYVFRWPVPASLPLNCISFAGHVFADFSGSSVTDSISAASCIQVVTPASLRMSSLFPDSVAYDTVHYQLVIANDGDVGVTLLLDSMTLEIIDSASRLDSGKSVLTGQVFVFPHDSLSLAFASSHAAAFSGDSASLRLLVPLIELGEFRLDTLQQAQFVHYLSPVEIQYVSGSLDPDTLGLDNSDTVRVRLRNVGAQTLVNVKSSEIHLTMTSASDTAALPLLESITPLSTFPPGDMILAFSLSASEARVSAGKYELTLSISGRQNNVSQSYFIAGIDSVVMAGAPRIRVDSVWAVAPNIPRVTVGQDFLVRAQVSNLGLEPLDSIRLRLTSSAGAIFLDTLSDPFILSGNSETYDWSVKADSAAVALETFQVHLDQATGRFTRQPALIVPALSDQTALQVQESSDLRVRLRLLSPPDALDGRVAAGSQFRVAGSFINAGEAKTSGAQMELLADSVLTVTGPTIISIAEGVDAVWLLTAPSIDTTAQIQLVFVDPPQELNTSVPGSVSVAMATVEIQTVFEAPPLVVFNVDPSGGAVGEEFVPLAWFWRNLDPSLLFPILVENLAFDVRTAGGQQVLDAATVLLSAQLEFEDDTIFAQLGSGLIQFGQDSLRRVAPGVSEFVSLRVYTRPTTSLIEFVITTRSAMWSCSERSIGGARLVVAVLDDRGDNIELSSVHTFQPGDVPTNYPNPFAAGLVSTNLQYTLASAAAMDIVIFTVSGREVWTFHANAGSPGGQQGVNTVSWDGRNGKGDLVLDGVYVARITGGGTSHQIKIVVVK